MGKRQAGHFEIVRKLITISATGLVEFLICVS